MADVKVSQEQATHGISVTRIFDGPRDLVFEQWRDPVSVAEWFAPDGFAVTACEIDVRPGGRWRVAFGAPDQGSHEEFGEYLEVVAPERLVFTLTQQDGRGQRGPKTLVTVLFVEQGSKTEMRFTQSGFTSASMRDGNAEGWHECFRKLEQAIAKRTRRGVDPIGSDDEIQIRRELGEWFRDSAAKDLDAVMTKVAEDVVSYEHDVPLQHIGREAVRQVCKRGFDAVPDGFTWDIPDLRVVVRGDIAVTWGLNHVAVQQDGRTDYESWSRGTRIFQKREGRWILIHQHVSYPYEPETGIARVDLKP